MRKNRIFLVFSAVLFCTLPVWGQSLIAAEATANPEPSQSPEASTSVTESERLFSASVGQRFYKIAYELANSEDVKGLEAEQAIVFLSAAVELGVGADKIRPLMIRILCRFPERNYSMQVLHLLVGYVDKSCDLEVARTAIRYLLERLDSREAREELLKGLLKDLGSKNLILGSEMVTSLGLLMAEKTDLEAAKFYFFQGYKTNKYNKLAFAKLAELAPEEIGPAAYLGQLILALRENPSNIEIALDIAQYAERLGLYETAADAYEYSADLFGYLYPFEPLSARIYLPWAISSYNTEQNQHECLLIARRVRDSGRFDLLLEAIAGRAAIKIGDTEQAAEIFRNAEEQAEQLLAEGPKANDEHPEGPKEGYPPRVGAKEFAWFYCFALPDVDKALSWANKAYSSEPNSASAAGILAYSLVMNDQIEWAKPLINNYGSNQIGDLTLAQIQLSQGQIETSIDTLKSVIAKDPGSLAAERAKEILAEQGGEYIPPVDPNIILNVLNERFDRILAPTFIGPDKMISVTLNIRGNKFTYGSEFGGIVAITNNSSEPLVISDDGLFKGAIRIDADISGDLTKQIANLVSVKVRTELLIEPGHSLLIPVRLITGELRQMLVTYPQASLDIEFTLYLDPVTTDEETMNRLANIKPTRLQVIRPGIKVTGKYLRNRFNSISTGHYEQKIKTAQLFIGLLREQYAMSGIKPPYQFTYADWMPGLLRSALLHESGLLRNPEDGEWVVKAHTMAEMLSLPLDHELISAVSDNLNNPNWPVRMMAVYLMAKTPDTKFVNVLNWAVKHDSNKLVRNMAIALGATEKTYLGPMNPPEPVESEKTLSKNVDEK